MSLAVACSQTSPPRPTYRSPDDLPLTELSPEFDPPTISEPFTVTTTPTSKHLPTWPPSPPQFADDCRTNGTAGRLRYVIEHFLTKALPHDAHLRCNGRTHIQFTRVFPYLKVLLQGQVRCMRENALVVQSIV